MESTFMEFILYNNWANQEVLHACQNLTETQLAQLIPGAYGTIRETLQHLVKAETHYLNILTGTSPQPPFKWEEGPGVAAMTAFSLEVGSALVAMVGHVSPTNVIVEDDNGTEFRYQALAVFIQIINHGIEHRTNITTILNEVELTPPDVDGWGYLTSHPDRFEAK